MEALQKLSNLRKAVYKIVIQGPLTEQTYVKFNRDIQQKSFKAPQALAVVINSPGGSAVKANLIRQRLLAYSKLHKIPLYTFTEDTAISGAYLILSAGDKSFGLTSSMLGGIGSAYYGLNFKGLAESYGIQRRSINVGAQNLSQKLDPLSEMSTETKQWLQSVLKDSHQNFKDIVKDVRGEKLFRKDYLEKGDVVFGQEAVDIGLIDRIGTVDQILKEEFQDYGVVDLSRISHFEKLMMRAR